MICAINSIDGRIQYAGNVKKTFTRKHFINFLRHIKRRFPDKKVCILTDNATIHKGIEVKNILEELDMKIIYTLPYSP